MLSIVIPSHNDGPQLAKLLPRISQTDAELIVVGSVTDPVAEAQCDKFGAQMHYAGKPCRGAQLDLGAQRASRPVIWFLHADATPPANAQQLILSAIGAGAAGGYFRFRFAGKQTLGKRVLAAGINLRVALGGTPYGDQGLFVTRSAYATVGGFPHQALFEEVRFIKNLRRLGEVRAITTAMAVDTRRWERDGWWRRSLHNRWLAFRFMLGTDPERLAANYGRRRR